MATNIPPVADNEIIATAWGNQVRSEVSTLEANKYAKAGGAISGNVSIAGTLTVSGATTLSQAATLSLAPTAAAHTTRKDYVDGQVAGKLGLAGGRITGDLQIGPGDGYDSVGIMLNNNGQILSHVTQAGATNMALSRSTTAGNAAGQAFAYFRRSSVPIGSIMINSALNGVIYNQTSDGRLKDDLGPIADPLDIIGRLRPRHLRWKNNGEEFDGFIAQEVAAVIPQAVTGDEASNPDPEDEPIQLATSEFIVYLVGAVQTLAARLAELEER